MAERRWVTTIVDKAPPDPAHHAGTSAMSNP
jgi:hypothetical protein